MKPAIIIIYGPTASGKSRLGLELAKQLDGVIINADSMQLYKELRVLTARPTVEEETQLPHALYGVVPAAKACSAGLWLDMVQPEIEKTWQSGKLPIIVGGTGMYIKTLMEGISPIPDILPEIREQTVRLVNEIGPKKLHEVLTLRDPVMGERLRPSDTQRLTRAYEVIEQTGKSLADWQDMAPEAPFRPEQFITLSVNMNREKLYERCDLRFAEMVHKGAMNEVEGLIAQKLPSDLPAMKVIGVPELTAYLGGFITLEQAIARAQQMTRNYAKRQLTWMRNQYQADIEAQPDWGDSIANKQKLLDQIGKLLNSRR